MYKASGIKVYILDSGREIELHQVDLPETKLNRIKYDTINKILDELKEVVPMWTVRIADYGLRSDITWDDENIVSVDYKITYEKDECLKVTGVDIKLIKKYQED